MKNKILILLAVAAFALAGATGMAMMSCDDKPKTPDPQLDPTCQEACTETQDNHLGRKDDGTLAKCDHNGKTIQGKCDCTEQTAELDGTDIVFSKAADVTVEEMDTAVAFFTDYFNNQIVGPDQTKIKGAITEVRIVSGNAAVKEGTIWKVGIGADKEALDDSLIFGWAMLQPQTKSTFLADKGNKGRAWVAKLMNDRIASVNDFRNVAHDKARGISI